MLNPRYLARLMLIYICRQIQQNTINSRIKKYIRFLLIVIINVIIPKIYCILVRK